MTSNGCGKSGVCGGAKNLMVGSDRRASKWENETLKVPKKRINEKEKCVSSELPIFLISLENGNHSDRYGKCY